MLVELAIRNFAIIDSARIVFGPGLNVLTGETGAGKSILIDALGAVLGDRVSSDVVRTGARTATIDATFDLERISNAQPLLALLDELEIEPEDGHLILSREVQSGGRSSARINGRPSTASVLSQVGGLLVDVHGQSDHLSLLQSSAQLNLLDRYARLMPVRESYAERFAELRRVRGALAEVRAGSRERMQRLDLLRYQIEEIAQAALRPEEEDEFIAERNRLANADLLARDAAGAYLLLAGGEDDELAGAALLSLRQAVQFLNDIAGHDQAAEPLRDRLSDALFLLEDVSAGVRDYRDAIEADPARLEVVEERLSLVRQLKRKYGADIPEILAHAQAAQDEYDRLTGSDVDADALAAQESALEGDVGRLAADLSRQRRQAAQSLGTAVEQSVADLQMGRSEFVAALEQKEDEHGVAVPSENGSIVTLSADATGVDAVTFLIAPNSGEALKPLSRIASGGETARLMLALKSILSDVDQTPTLIFDEIDVGVGGRSGQVVGEKLWRLAMSHQVIVITHLPQIAALADAHFRIVKSERDERVVSTVEELLADARKVELAAMLDGVPVTESSLSSAAEMLRRATAVKKKSVAAG